MSSFVVFIFAVGLIQAVFSQCIGGNGALNTIGGVYGPGLQYGQGLGAGLPAIASLGTNGINQASGFGGVGNGDVAVAGELGVSGATQVLGQIPVMGAVQFSGTVPAAGRVSISGSCGCPCNFK